MYCVFPSRCKLSKSARSKKQVSADKKALKILQKTGLYRGKIDLRKAPSKYQSGLIKKFSDVISGSAKVIATKAASLYRKIFPTAGKLVAVPAKPSDKLVTDEKGEIVRKRKTGDVERSHRFLSREKVGAGTTKLKINRRYGLPFRAGALGHDIRWFPNKKALEVFMTEYEYEDWEDYVIEEEIEYKPRYEHERDVDYDRIDELRRASPQYKARYKGKL